MTRLLKRRLYVYKWEAERSHKIREYFVNVGILVCTVVLAAVSIWQSWSAQSAASIAERTLQQTKRYNDSLSLVQKREFELRKLDDERRAKTDSQRLVLQFTVLSESRSNFNKINEPFLQIDSLHVFFLEKSVHIKAQYANLGNFPVEIMGGAFSLVLGEERDAIDDRKWDSLLNDIRELHGYAARGSPYLMDNDIIGSPLTAIQTQEYKLRKLIVVFSGRLKYKNLITDEVKTYRYKVANQYQAPFQILLSENKKD